jgi:hypothetical protein
VTGGARSFERRTVIHDAHGAIGNDQVRVDINGFLRSSAPSPALITSPGFLSA